MNDYLKKVGGNIFEFVKALSPMRKVALGLTLVAVCFGMAMAFMWAGDTAYETLMANLNSEDSANVMRALREKGIPFKVDGGGKNIAVPKEVVYETRMALANMGLPQSSVIGYEVFDKQMLGTTSFVQKINQKRAREGELMRTIQTIRGVKRSRVHLAMPEKSTFVEDQKKSTASVVLDLEPGVVLTDKQIFGIGNLVARAVEGMDVNDVVIVDAMGKMLSKNSTDPLAAATATQLDFKQKVERDLEDRIETILSKVVGEGRVAATVSADLDFSQVSETQTTYDQDGAAVKSTEKNSQSMEGTRPGPYGLAGNTSNQPDRAPAANGEVRTDTKRVNETTNFAVPQTVRHLSKPTGSVKRLSVAVVLDGKQVKTTGKDGQVTTKVETWSQEKLEEFKAIVMGAAAIDAKRGDTLEIRNLEFSHEDFTEAEQTLKDAEFRNYIKHLVIYLVIGLTILAFFVFVVRPFIKWITENTIESVDSFLPQTIEELEKLNKNNALAGLEDVVPVMPEKVDPEKVEGEMIKEKIITLVDANPHKAALILRDWLHSAPSKPEDDRGGGGKSKSA